MKSRNSILSQSDMKREILESHKRSLQYNISREERSPEQARLSPSELEAQKSLRKELLDIVYEYIGEFYELLSPDQFMIAIVDSQGYILHLSGSDTIKAEFAERNYAPGYRFTERDVGTTATSLCLERKVPVQLNDKEIFCAQAHGFTSSAAPIFDEDDILQGILVVSGRSSLVHPHTMIMVTSAARSIEKQMRLVRRNRELSIYTGFLQNVLESAETGLITVDNELRIRKANRKAKRIFRHQGLEGKPVSAFKGFDLNLESIYKNPESWKGKECHIQSGDQAIHIVYSAQPVTSDQHGRLGAVLVFEEFKNLRKIADKISAGNAYFTFDHLIGESATFRKALELAKRASQSNSSVLLLGETGTGKELFAQAIHNAGSQAGKPFIPVNCGAIPWELMESELFGYVDGAFSGALKGGRPGRFELADGGTILLDEIGDMPLNMQVKLLRVLQTGEIQRLGDTRLLKVDVRVIASTNVSLPQAIAQGRFRQDLYYRLNILPITIPPLRERGASDVQALAGHFLNRYKPGVRLTTEAVQALVAYDWPGNVRELENTIQRAMHMCDTDIVDVNQLGLSNKKSGSQPPEPGSLAEMERRLIESTLEETKHNVAESAKRLGISRATLYRKVKQYNISITRCPRS